MTLSHEELALVSAARRGEPGALRALAVCLDQRLADADDNLDGAVAAWQAVQRPRARTGSRVLDTVAGWRASLGGRLSPSRLAHPERTGAAEGSDRRPRLDHRPAA